MKQKIENLFLDYVNNFLSIEGFASYYGFDDEYAKRIIKIGQKLNDRWSVSK